MADGARVAAWSVVVHLGQAVTQPVPEARRRQHAWLARSLNGLGVDPRFRKDSAYLSLKQLSTEPSKVQRYVEPPADLPDDATIILDLSDAPYDLLNEPLLAGLAGGVARMLAGGPRTVLLLLRKLPQESLLWQVLDGQVRGDPGRVVVLDDDGELRSYGHGRRGFRPLHREWPERRREARGAPRERFQRRVVTRLGHFATAHGERCTLAWQDMRGAVDELGECISEFMADLGRPGHRLIVCGPCSRELRVAAMVAADMHGGNTAFAPTPDDVDEVASEVGNLLVFEHVRSGESLGDFRRARPTWRAPVVDRALAVLATPDALGLEHPDLRVEVLAVGGLSDVRQEACKRCSVGTPRIENPTQPDPMTGIDAATMWWMLDEVHWGPEGYGPPDAGRYPYIPDFLAVFERFGDWIAVKYEELVKELGMVEDLVVVCPAEPAVRDLVKRLAARFEHQLVPIEIEREVISEVAKDPAKAMEIAATALCEADGETPGRPWERQLADLARRASGGDRTLGVIALDEFNASGSTAAGLAALLDAFGVEIDAYVPFVDWSGGRPSEGPRRRSLYAFFNPRPAA